MAGRISIEEHQKTIEQAKTAQKELADAQKELADLKTLNKQMLTEMRVECGEPVVPVLDAKFINGLGKFMVPVEDTLTNHYRLIYDRSNELDFWPEQSPAFDWVVAQTFLDPAFSSPSHPQYFDYEPLRDNVAAVRNYVMHAVLNGVDPSSKKQLEKANKTLEQMGREIGVALQRDSLFRRPGSNHLNVRSASIPGAGAAEIYALLVKKQEKNKFMRGLKKLFGFDYSAWNLLPVEQSPFSKGHVDTFCLGEFSVPDNPSHLTEMEAMEMARASKTALQEAEETLAQQESEMLAAGMQPASMADAAPTEPAQSGKSTHALQISALGAAIAGSAFSLDRVKRLPQPVKQRAVEIARDILDKLRIDLGSADNTQWLTFSEEETLAQGEAISSLASLYGESYQAALAANPQLKDDPAIQAGNEAIGKLAYLMKLQSSYKLLDQGRREEAQMVLADTDLYPQSWKQVEGVRVTDLLDQVQQGLERSHNMTQQAVHVPPAQGNIPPAVPAPLPVPRQMTGQQLQQMLQNNGMERNIETMRHMQSQAATMPLDMAQQFKHINTAGRTFSPVNSVASQGNYRNVVQGQQRETSEYLKR